MRALICGHCSIDTGFLAKWLQNMMTILNRSSTLLKMSDIVGTASICHRNQAACIGSEKSPVLHGVMLSRDQTMQGASDVISFHIYMPAGFWHHLVGKT